MVLDIMLFCIIGIIFFKRKDWAKIMESKKFWNVLLVNGVKVVAVLGALGFLFVDILEMF